MKRTGNSCRSTEDAGEPDYSTLPVLWRSTATFVQHLLAAKRDLRLPQVLAQLDRYGCLNLDDIGYVQQDRDEMEVLFTVLAERYERKTHCVTKSALPQS